MKKILCSLILLITLCIGINVYAADDIMKISMDGEVKIAKDIGNGKGISFVLPELTDNNYYLEAIELAVFEKKDGKSQYSIYTDANGEESKKLLLENPKSLNVQVDFGKPSDYADKAKYKLGYRYHVVSKDDEAIRLIANADVKDGWCLVGEGNPQAATNSGFVFYKNANPTFDIYEFTYTVHTPNSDRTEAVLPSDLPNTVFPADVFTNGVVIQMTANDFDKEDILTAQCVLKNADTNAVLYQGILGVGNLVTADIRDAKRVSLKVIVNDNYGGSAESEEYIFNIDTEKAFVTDEFDDGGYYLRGGCLFSDFYINDDTSSELTDGEVLARIACNGREYREVMLTKIKNGVYRLHEKDVPDGEYIITLLMYDKSGNVSEHIVAQKLDNTGPEAEFVSPEEYYDATYYSTWMNESKYIVADVTDSMAGFKGYKLNLNGLNMSSVTYHRTSPEARVIESVTRDKTGKLRYDLVVNDNAKDIDFENNCYKNGSGNEKTYSKEVWIDKTLPTITSEHNSDTWHGSPYTMTAEAVDYPSSTAVEDASGVEVVQYSITESGEYPMEWTTYADGITITNGGVWDVHIRAIDYAGNQQTATYRAKINNPAEIVGMVEPASDYWHTIYYSEPDFYVVKNTAYNTKYHFEVSDIDVLDSISAHVKLVSQDDASKYTECDILVPSTGDTVRDVVFNIPYTDESGEALPDGVYDMLLTVKEIKNDGEEYVSYDEHKACEIVIKRNSPPTPEIEVSGTSVSINYPHETLSGSLNNDRVKTLYRKEYKAVIEGDPASNLYRTYTGALPVQRMVVTALYTDIAGNTSTTTKRIFSDDGSGGGDGDDMEVGTSGNTTRLEESRAGNVYYIGIRRETTNGINGDVFGFMN